MNGLHVVEVKWNIHVQYIRMAWLRWSEHLVYYEWLGRATCNSLEYQAKGLSSLSSDVKQVCKVLSTWVYPAELKDNELSSFIINIQIRAKWDFCSLQDPGWRPSTVNTADLGYASKGYRQYYKNLTLLHNLVPYIHVYVTEKYKLPLHVFVRLCMHGNHQTLSAVSKDFIIWFWGQTTLVWLAWFRASRIAKFQQSA